jgi:hypothetical protein
MRTNFERKKRAFYQVVRLTDLVYMRRVIRMSPVLIEWANDDDGQSHNNNSAGYGYI